MISIHVSVHLTAFLEHSNTTAEGRAYPDRNWTECFAQLVGTVLSLWDAAALDAAGQDGEVAPTFINLADASIKMVCHSSYKPAHTDNCRLRPFPPATPRWLLFRTSYPSLPQAKIDTCFISTPCIL
jgi:CCR4-NOT transcriptional complex subunit CAF120